MAGQEPQWEHCRLFLIAARFPQDPTSKPRQATPAEAHYHLQVVYMGPDGT